MNIRQRPTIHVSEESLAVKFEQCRNVVSVHRGVRIHGNHPGRKRREVDLIVTMRSTILLVECKHYKGRVYNEKGSSVYYQENRDDVSFDANTVVEIASDLKAMYTDSTGAQCPTILPLTWITHPEGYVDSNGYPGDAWIFGPELLDNLESLLRELDTIPSTCRTEEFDDFLSGLNQWDVVEANGVISFGDVEDSDFASLRTEFEIVQRRNIRGRLLTMIFGPKYQLFGIQYNGYDWIELDLDETIVVKQPGQNDAIIKGEFSAWFGCRYQRREELVGGEKSNLSELIERSEASQRREVLTNIVGNSTHGIVCHTSDYLSLIQLAPSVVGSTREILEVGSVVNVEIGDVIHPKKIELRVVEN
jgi:hypothetical protein